MIDFYENEFDEQYAEEREFDVDEDDGDALASAGLGTDEDYSCFGSEDAFLDGSYEE